MCGNNFYKIFKSYFEKYLSLETVPYYKKRLMINAGETKIQDRILGETNTIPTVDGTQKDSLKQVLPPLFLINF